jgi:hypothetical protein
MATFKKNSAGMMLNKSERSQLKGVMDQHIRKTAAQYADNKARNAAIRKRLRTPLLASLQRQFGDLDKICQPGLDRYTAERKRLLKQQPAKPRRFGTRRIIHPNAVFAATFGLDKPAYDDNWEYHDPNPPRNLIDQFVADPTNGQLSCKVSNRGGGSSQSGAGLMFWYVPDKTAVLTVSVAPAVQEEINAGAWHDQGNASTYLGVGIQRWAREPFVFVDWAAQSINQLDSLGVGWKDIQVHNESWDVYQTQASCQLDTRYFYSCWAWITALTYCTGDGFGYASVQTTIDSFAFWVV